MQGQKSTIGSLPESLGFDHGSASSDAGIDQQICYISDYISPSNTSITYPNSMSQEGPSLSGWNIGEPSSSNTENQLSCNEQKMEHEWSSSIHACAGVGPILEERRYEPANIFSLNNINVNLSNNQMANGPLFLPTSSSDSVPRDLNVSSGFVGPGVNDCPNAYRSVSSENVRIPSASSSSDPFLEGRRLSCKRKAIEGTVGQSSGSGTSNYFQRAEGSAWHGGPACRNASSSLFISNPSENTLGVSALEEVNPGLGLGVGGVDSQSPIALSPESSRRNFRMRINASHQQDSIPTNVFSSGSANLSSPHPSSIIFPVSSSSDLRTTPAADNTIPNEQPVVLRVPGPRRNLQSSRWNRSSISRTVGSSSVISGERDAAPYQEPSSRTMPRNISEHPIFVPATGVSNLAQNPVNWSLTGGNISIAGSGSGVHPSSAPNWVPHRNPSQYPRRLPEFVRRSLSSTGSEPGGQSSNFGPPGSGSAASLQEVALSSGEQGHHLSHSRSAMMLDRQLDRAFGMSTYSLRTLAAAGEGRSRLVSEIRNVLDIMRRGEGLRFEDVMILDQSVFFGMSGIHDRHRDMRLDVDNMSYEELLALEERIGNVNTGLSEETILNRLKQRKCLFITTGQLEAESCCICQEEYKIGEDLGMLECGHDFHTHCIKQWLMQKNLCPICKTTALVT